MAVPILWRNKQQRYSLEGDICPICNRAVFPPRPLCPYCSREDAGQRQESTGQASIMALVLPAPEMNGHLSSGHLSNGHPSNGTQHNGARKRDENFGYVLPHRLALREAGDD